MKKIIFILLLGIQLIFTSCTSSPIEDKSEQTATVIKDTQEDDKVIDDAKSEETSSCTYHLENLDLHLSYLTSEECEGRLVGTVGNQLAGDYIKKIFEDMELAPFFNSFYDEYPQTIYPFEQQTHELTATFKDGSEKTYTYGTDYLERNRMENVDFTVEITDYANDSALSEKAFLLAELSQYRQVRDKVKAAFLKEDAFFGVPKVAVAGTPIIQITDELYDVLKFNKVDKVIYKSIYHPVESTQNNIVGMIKGKNADKAIIISAHFDHVGAFGDTIFAGAVDNGSGVAVLLEVAKELKARSIESPFESDIIFCAFNGEEEGLRGSKAFLEDITDTYKSLANINIDCVGKTYGGSLIIEGEPKVNGDLAKIIESLIIPYEHHYEVGELGLSSDHETFIAKNIPAVNLGQEDVFQDNASIHTKDDDMDNIDDKYLHDMIHLVCDSIAQADLQYFELSSDDVDKASNNTSRSSETDPFKSDAYYEAREKILKIEEERKDELKYDEYLFYVVGKYYGTISGNKPLTDVNELHLYYPDIIITESLGDYIFQDIHISNDSNSSSLSIGYPFSGDLEKNNKVFKRTFNYDDHPRVKINYKKEQLEFTISIRRFPASADYTSLNYELERYDYTKDTTDTKTIYWLKSKESSDNAGVIEDYKTDKYRFIISVKPKFYGSISKDSDTSYYSKEVIQEFYNLVDNKQLLIQLNLMN